MLSCITVSRGYDVRGETVTRYRYTFTVFTPTYNRAHTLPRVYDSLKTQTFRDFEWLIVDDGSSDGTGALVKQWQHKASFPISYIWQENGGKHAAINRAALEARGELFLFLDSDNAYIPTALERFKFHWDSIPTEQKEKFSAVTALTQDPQGNIIGSRFPFDPTDSDSLEICFRYKVVGEKSGFHRTEVLKQFPFPRFEGETWQADSLAWYKIALQYKTRYVNEPLQVYYSDPNSWSANIYKLRAENPKGARLYFKEYVNLEYPIPKTRLLRGYANYVRYCCHAGIRIASQVRDIPSSLYWLAALPIGYLAYFRDKQLLSKRTALLTLLSLIWLLP